MVAASLPRRASAGLCAMVSWCFHVSPSIPSNYDAEFKNKRRMTPHSDNQPVVVDEDPTAIGSANQPPPRWVHDAAIDTCMQCTTTFDLIVRKHHCRACGGVFCNQCTSQTECVIKYGFSDPVRVCFTCSIQSRAENEFYERNLPLLERGAMFYKYGILRKRLVMFKFIRSMLIFQYQSVDVDTFIPYGDVKAFPLDSILDVKEVGIDKENGLIGLIIVLPMREECRLDALTTQQRQQWIAAIQSVRGIRNQLVVKAQTKQQREVEQTSLQQRKEELQRQTEKQQIYREEQLRKRAEQRDTLRRKYNLSNATTAAS